MITTPNMGLKVWNLVTDVFDHSQLASTHTAIDLHDHSANKGVQIGTAGIANSAVTASKIAAGAITTAQINASAGITLGQLAPGVGQLAVTSKTTTYAAAVGDLVLCTGSFVVTAPAPVANGVFGVYAVSGMTGASAITITRHATDGFYGLGMTGATNCYLGIPGSYVVFESNGTNWVTVSGQQDTGWVAIPPPGGYTTASGYYTPATRLIGDTVLMRGIHTNGSGIPSSYNTTLATIFRPAAKVQLRPIDTDITTAGVISYTSSDGNSVFDNQSYALV